VSRSVVRHNDTKSGAFTLLREEHGGGYLRADRRSVTFGLTVFSACAFSLASPVRFLKFRTKAQMRVTLPIHRTPHGQYGGLPRSSDEGLVMRLERRGWVTRATIGESTGNRMSSLIAAEGGSLQ
jgi:hypothetical protein